MLIGFASASGQIWKWQHPLPEGNSIVSLATIGEKTVWAGAGGGTLLKSEDSGIHWQIFPLPIHAYVLSVFFWDENTGWVGGQDDNGNGVILSTTNGGGTWESQFNDPSGDFRTIFFVSRGTGWASGQLGNIYQTTDGGAHWLLRTSFLSQFIYRLHFSDSLRGSGLAYDGLFLRTTDGGTTWSSDTLDFMALDMVFLDSSNVWGCGYGKIKHSRDGGRTWKSCFDTLTSVAWTSISAMDTLHAWAVSTGGLLTQTSDGGRNWFTRDYSTSVRFRAVRFLDLLHGVSVGLGPGLLWTSDGGRSWQSSIESVTTDVLTGISAVSSDTCWMAGGTTVISSTNGGTTWFKAPEFTASHLRDIWFISASRGWIVGDGGTIYQSIDGGRTWNAQSSPVTDDLLDIDFTNYPTGWIVGGGPLLKSVLIKSTDGGESWHDVTPGNLPPSSMKIRFSTTSAGWILLGGGSIGAMQAVYGTQDSGRTWQKVLELPGASGLAGLEGYDERTAWVSALCDSLYKTTDRGVTWQVHSTPEPFEVLFFLDSQHGWGGSTGGQVYATSDGGLSWNSTGSLLALDVAGLYFVDLNHGWMTGARGSILHTGDTPTGILDTRRSAQPLMEKPPALQCYPNPFNGYVHIRVTVHSQVREAVLIIYDILGREVYKTAQRYPAPGTYFVDWNGTCERGTPVSSGIYILDLRTEAGRTSSKLLIMK